MPAPSDDDVDDDESEVQSTVATSVAGHDDIDEDNVSNIISDKAVLVLTLTFAMVAYSHDVLLLSSLYHLFNHPQ